MIHALHQQLGHYRLIRFLGRGGFADVYLGEHLRLRTQAAIKILHLSLKDDDLEAFLHEAQTVARLKHPHIVRVFDFDVEGQTPFLIMDYLPHGSMRQRYPKGTALPLTTVLPALQQVASALAYAHQAKLVHRDVKPENLLLDERDAIVLSDFGTALIVQSSLYQSTQGIAGTAAYMAPEQFQGKARRASDQYSLGVVVYEWLTGTRPFQGSFTEIASQHLFVTPPPLLEKVPTIPQAIEEVVLRALAKNPQERFASVQAFAEAFEQASQTIARERSQSPTTHLEVSGPMLQDAHTASPLRTREENPASAATLADLFPLSSGLEPSPSSASNQTSLPVASPDHAVGLRHAKGRTPLLIGTVCLVVLTIAALFSTTVIRLSPSAASRSPAQGVSHPQLHAAPAMFGFDQGHTRLNPDEHLLGVANVSRLVPYWTFSTTSTITSSPTVAGGFVFVGSGIQKLYALGTASGKVLWSASTGGAISSSPAVVNGVVYAGSDDHKLYAFDALTGKLLWSVATGGMVLSSPTVDGGLVYIGSQDSRLYAFGASTGKLLWSAVTGDAITSSPAVANGAVYVGSHDHKLYAFDAATGRTRWTASTGNAIDSSPTVSKGVIYVGSEDFKVYAMDAHNGRLLWSTSTGFFLSSSPAIAYGLVYIGSYDRSLYAFDAVTGRTRWVTYIGGAIGPSSPMIANGVVYVGSQNGKLYALDASNGKVLWFGSTNAGMYSSPTVADGVVYVGSNDTSLHAFHLPGTSLARGKI